MKDARPKITSNTISDNDGIGLFIRDVSTGIIIDNNIRNNEVELVLDRMNKDLENIVSKDNLVIGDIRIP
jgi:parallel beta-helix repeat protein